ncbi:hypothetical protein EVAR_61003_1 [Eumeta japonica]|uniref:Uncharacterized protein n=1 Tax=Eumeta variegata TaxID=151549 RepID=A0A4C1ZBF6_EUMVA|nr:hypothetical protein EVAR_61003_1 [Eumeta japonica]
MSKKDSRRVCSQVAGQKSSSAGEVTRRILPNAEEAFRAVKSSRLTPIQEQVLRGYGGIASYSHRFHLKDNPGCKCDAEVEEILWHILPECPRFLAACLQLENRTRFDPRNNTSCHGQSHRKVTVSRICRSHLSYRNQEKQCSSETHINTHKSEIKHTKRKATPGTSAPRKSTESMQAIPTINRLGLRPKETAHKENSEFHARIRAFLGALGRAAKRLPCVKYPQGANTSQVKRKKPTVPINPKTAPTRAQKGEVVDPPVPVPVRRLRDHYALLKFIVLTLATLKVHKATCEGILSLYQVKFEAWLTAALENAKAAIYHSDSQTILRGKMSVIHMMDTLRQIARIALEERFLEMAKTVTRGKASANAWENWVVPDITWVNEVLGCEKTTWVMKYLELRRAVVVTTTREAVRSLRLDVYSDADIPKDLPNTHYLTHTQVEKESLKTQGFGKGEGTRVLTKHRA